MLHSFLSLWNYFKIIYPFAFRISGWKQKEHPILYNALHIGDQMISIGGVAVHNSSDANKMIRNSPGLYVSMPSILTSFESQNSTFFLRFFRRLNSLFVVCHSGEFMRSDEKSIDSAWD